MTARSRMSQRAHVQRYTSPGDDDSGNPLPGDWAAYIEAVPIWLYGSTEREPVTGETTAVVAALKAMVPLSTDISESDRLGGEDKPAIVDRRGTVIEPGILGIETILRKRSHLQLTLSRVGA